MVQTIQLVGIGILGLETILYQQGKITGENDEIAHFVGGVALGLVTQNHVVQIAGILGWEVLEQYTNVLTGKYPIGVIDIELFKDTMKDIIITSIGTYIGTKISGK